MNKLDRVGLMNPDFRYVRAAETNLAKTFARVKRQQKEAEATKPANVKQLRKAKA